MNEKTSNYPRRAVRSFVLRAGRLTRAQQRALDELYPQHGIDESPGLLDLEQLFGRRAPVVVEIGFGNGAATWRMARQEPDVNFIGLEVHPPGVGHLLLALQERQLQNVRVAMTDAVAFLEQRLADECLSGVRIYFPDPWPKKRHHKRRIIQPAFVDLLARKLAPGGLLHLATDWVPYAEHMLEVLSASPSFTNLSPVGDYHPQPEWRPDSKYAQRGDRLGHEIRDLLFERRA